MRDAFSGAVVRQYGFVDCLARNVIYKARDATKQYKTTVIKFQQHNVCHRARYAGH